MKSSRISSFGHCGQTCMMCGAKWLDCIMNRAFDQYIRCAVGMGIGIGMFCIQVIFSTQIAIHDPQEDIKCFLSGIQITTIIIIIFISSSNRSSLRDEVLSIHAFLFSLFLFIQMSNIECWMSNVECWMSNVNKVYHVGGAYLWSFFGNFYHHYFLVLNVINPPISDQIYLKLFGKRCCGSKLALKTQDSGHLHWSGTGTKGTKGWWPKRNLPFRLSAFSADQPFKIHSSSL